MFTVATALVHKKTFLQSTSKVLPSNKCHDICKLLGSAAPWQSTWNCKSFSTPPFISKSANEIKQILFINWYCKTTSEAKLRYYIKEHCSIVPTQIISHRVREGNYKSKFKINNKQCICNTIAEVSQREKPDVNFSSAQESIKFISLVWEFHNIHWGQALFYHEREPFGDLKGRIWKGDVLSPLLMMLMPHAQWSVLRRNGRSTFDNLRWGEIFLINVDCIGRSWRSHL